MKITDGVTLAEVKGPIEITGELKGMDVAPASKEKKLDSLCWFVDSSFRHLLAT